MNKSKKAVYTATTAYVNISDIHEAVIINGGYEDDTRWDLSIPTVRKAYEELITSIKKNGFLAGVVAIQLPKDVTLFEVQEYKKGNWLAMDVSGRLRALKDLEERGWVINPDTEIEGQISVLDVTHIVLKDGYTVNEEIIEKLWHTIVKLNTGQLKWTDFQFISSGSRAITDPEQIVIWKYLAESMKKYHPELSNKVVLATTIHTLTDGMKRKAKINFNMKYKRYSDIILKRLLEIRMALGSSDAAAPFLRALANYFREASTEQRFYGAKYLRDGTEEEGTHKNCFSFAGKIYEDEHFFEFKRYLDYISLCFEECMPPDDGFAGTLPTALKEIHRYMLKFQKKWNRKGN